MRLTHMKKTSLVFIMAGLLACAAHAEIFDVSPPTRVALNHAFDDGQAVRGNLLLAGALVPTGGAFTSTAQRWDGESALRKVRQDQTGGKPAAGHAVKGIKSRIDDTVRTGDRQGMAWQSAWGVPTVAWWWMLGQQTTLAAPNDTVEPRFDASYAASTVEDIASEPEQWSMMLIGAGMVAFQIRRKQNRFEGNRLARDWNRAVPRRSGSSDNAG